VGGPRKEDLSTEEREREREREREKETKRVLEFWVGKKAENRYGA